jgi:hypothetical protein
VQVAYPRANDEKTRAKRSTRQGKEEQRNAGKLPSHDGSINEYGPLTSW